MAYVASPPFTHTQVVKLVSLPPGDVATSVCWSQRGAHLAIGTHSGRVELWDAGGWPICVAICARARFVGALGWCSQACPCQPQLCYLHVTVLPLRPQCTPSESEH